MLQSAEPVDTSPVPALLSRLRPRFGVVTGLVTMALVACTIAATVIVSDLLRERGREDALLTSKILVTLAIGRNEAAFTGSVAHLNPSQLADISADIERLRARGDILGMELWSPSGALLYADKGRTAEDVQLPAPERLRVLAGETIVVDPEVQLSGGQGGVAVLWALDQDHDGRYEAIAEVQLPRSPAALSATTAERMIYALAALQCLLSLLLLGALRRRLRQRHHEARQDSLTGLGNRVALAEALAARRRMAGSVSLLLLDLDGFKLVNDTLGHAAGDALLIQVGKALLASVRDGDLVVRLGGDEFAILLVAGTTEDQAALVGLHVRRDLTNTAFQVAQVQVDVDASIGVATTEEHTAGALSALLARADLAMYAAKRAGSGVHVFDAGLETNDVLHLALLGQLRQSISHGDLVLHYQPKMRSDGTVAGVEALVRWQHPERGLLPPADFLPLAEQTSLVHPLTDWVLREAVRQAVDWRSAGYELSVAVNISPRSLTPTLPALVLEVLAAYGLPPQLLELEITETAVANDPVVAVEVLRQLRTVGVRISLDDFGAGYTSLAYLTEMSLDCLKIDRGFVRDITTNTGHQTIASAVLDLARRLGLDVIAEGVEDTATSDTLVGLGCQQMQGYLWSRPLPAHALEGWLAARELSRIPGQLAPRD